MSVPPLGRLTATQVIKIFTAEEGEVVGGEEGGFVYYVGNPIFSRISLHPGELAQLECNQPTNSGLTVSSFRPHYFPLIECFFLSAGCFYSWIIIRLVKLFD